MDTCDAAVIGGGPAGLFSAIHCSAPGRRVVLLEKGAACGSKLLLTGSGQCNITHEGTIRSFFPHYGLNGHFLKPALLSFSNQDLIHYFNDHGIATETDDRGKIFPASHRSEEILGCLLSDAQRHKVSIRYKEPVMQVGRNKDLFALTTGNGTLHAGSLVIATGGRSYPETGSTGDGYRFAAALGHTIRDPAPALTPLKITDFPFPDLAGISFPGMAYTLWRGAGKVAQYRGDVLFTHDGLSGPGILDHSRSMRAGDEIRLSFSGSLDRDRFAQGLRAELRKQGKTRLSSVLGSYGIPARVVRRILELVRIEPDMTCSHLTTAGRTRLVAAVTGLPLIIGSLGDFSVAMVTRGGVDLGEVNAKTMESRIVKNLYFAGEVLDIDGDTGGYNLQAAFSTGRLSGKSIWERSARGES